MKPDKFPDWATEEQIDPVSGQNNVVEPPDIRKQSGWTRREIPPRQWFNWLAKKTAEWLRWFEPRADKVDAATPEATPNALILRDGNGRASIVTPEATAEIANKGYVDSVTAGEVGTLADEVGTLADNFDDHVADTDPHSATPEATPNRIILRDASGRAQVAAPSAEDDIARKAEVDAVIPSGTKMLFKQNSAPTGWTFLSEDNDRVLLNTSVESEGGNTGGSWTISGISVAGHALTKAELPVISGYFEIKKMQGGDIVRTVSGDFTRSVVTAGVTPRASDEGGSVDVDRISLNVGGGGYHGHGINLGDTWRPAYTKVITCRKD
jgi:HAMP domain-containing protein